MTQEEIRKRYEEIKVEFDKFLALANQLDQVKQELERIFQSQYGVELDKLRLACKHTNKAPNIAYTFKVCPDCGLAWLIP